MKILCIGNSFSEDTTMYLPDILKAAGYENFKVCNLFVGGCSINRHCNHAREDLPAYRWDTHTGSGWTRVMERTMKEAILSDTWDWISIQHGSGDGSRYTQAESYEQLPWLISYVKELANKDAKIAFNMTWIGEPESRSEISRYGGDQILTYNLTAQLTKELIVPMPGIDKVCPTGTAIQNGRAADMGLLTRDNYHLSLDHGRYLAAMAFYKALTDNDITDLPWVNDDEQMRQKAIAVIHRTMKVPFEITNP